MKPFNLALALAGKPVQLRTGQKAVILYYIPEVYKYENGTSVTHPLRGIIFNKQGKIITTNEGWTEDGAIALNHEHNFDIIGMWEEPKLTTEDIMEKAFQEKLTLTHSLFPSQSKGFKVIGKTLDNVYILQNCDDNEVYFSNIFRKDSKWSIKE